ncbi:putative phenol 2-monooxygenase [Fusarium avenaceum]|nr:putative phenol 2-monooxygenase [Fusarium avenaceum]
MNTTSKTDVLIVGAGPAGLAAAWWLARCGIDARVVDKKGSKVYKGQADGLMSRTIEILDSMGCGLSQRVDHESYLTYYMDIWTNEDGKLKTTQSIGASEGTVGAPPFHASTISQGRIERYIIDAMRDPSNLNPTLPIDRGVLAEALEIDQSAAADPNAYPVSVKLRHLPLEEANATVGATSAAGTSGLATSNLMGENWEAYANRSNGLKGQIETVQAKGAMDVVPITDFRGMLIIPRERGLSRVYVPYHEVDTDSQGNTAERFDRSEVTLDKIKAIAQRMFLPYKFDFKICEWWSAYQVGQRVASRSQDATGRVLLAGDAVHTHSPKVGLGANTSIQDGWNMGWKLAMALANKSSEAPPTILASYESERHPVAQMLIDYDRAWSQMFMGNTARSHGRAFNYPEGPLISRQTSMQSAAKNIEVGESFPHAYVVLHANPQEWITTKILRADGRFRIILLPGDLSIADRMTRAREFCNRVTSSNPHKGDSLLYTRYPYPFSGSSTSKEIRGQNPDDFIHYRRHPKSLIELITISHSTESADQIPVRFEDLPEAMRGQFDAECFGWNYETAFMDVKLSAVAACGGGAYERWGVDQHNGAVVVVRPDMHVGWVGAIKDVKGLEGYFENLSKSF